MPVSLNVYVSGDEDTDNINLAFSKHKADARKEWLTSITEETYIDHTSGPITYSDFVNKELILFSYADNCRSIPSVVDGLKPGQRKIVFSCFKRNLVKEVKVAQLAGYVSEKSAYHHGALYQPTISHFCVFLLSSSCSSLLCFLLLLYRMLPSISIHL